MLYHHCVGYTHYWYRPLSIPLQVFQAIRLDFGRLVLPLADCDVLLASGLGEGVPVIDNDIICFNGLRACGHPRNERIVIPYPSDDACGVGPSAGAVEDNGEELMTRIKYRCCDGRCSYETFVLPRSLEFDELRQPDANGLYFEFTKTGFRPYDIAVTAALLIAKKHLKDSLIVHSDGRDRQWSDAKSICQDVLGYGNGFGVVEEQIEESWPDETVTQTVSIRTLIEIDPPL